jgi:hypothetical protein
LASEQWRLNGSISQHRVDPVGHGLDQIAHEPGRLHLPEMREAGLETIEAVVERQERISPEGDDNRLPLGREHG